MRWIIEDQRLRDSVQSIIDRNVVDGEDAQALKEIVARMDKDIERNKTFREIIRRPGASLPDGAIVC